MAQTKPRRKRKADALTYGAAKKVEVMADYALAPFDRMARDMDRKWGVDRLPSLVSPDLAKKYGAALAHLNECINDDKPDETAAAARNCIKGMAAMDAEATAAGHTPPQLIAEYDLNGFHFGVIDDAGDWAAIQRDGLRLFSIREVAIALEAYANNKSVSAVKEKFPGAEITKIKNKPPVDWENGGDAIPF